MLMVASVVFYAFVSHWMIIGDLIFLIGRIWGQSRPTHLAAINLCVFVLLYALFVHTAFIGNSIVFVTCSTRCRRFFASLCAHLHGPLLPQLEERHASEVKVSREPLQSLFYFSYSSLYLYFWRSTSTSSQAWERSTSSH